MKQRLLYILLMLVLGTGMVVAQDSRNIFGRGKGNQIGLGVGFWTGSREFTPVMPQVFVNYERLLADFGRAGSLGLGLHLSYLESRYDRFDDEDWILKNGIAGLRATYHYTIIKRRLEAYVGAMAGYKTNKLYNSQLGLEVQGDHKRKGGFAYSFSAGLKYWFIPALGLSVGVGDGVFLNVGLTTRF